MERPCIKTYRNIEIKARYLGLEIEDWGALTAFAGIMFSMSKNALLNIPSAAILWAWLYFVKASKPEGWIKSWLSFQRSPKVLKAELEEAFS